MASAVPVWNPVAGPSFKDANALRANAIESMNGAFTGLEDILKKRQAIETANYTQGGVNNSETLKAMLYGAKTPEAMQALQASGEYDRARAAMGAQIKDPDAITALAEGRLGNLRRDELAGFQHGDALVERVDAPLRDAASSLYAQGKFTEGDLVAQSVQRNRAGLFEASRVGQRRGVTEKQADTVFANGQSDQRMQEALHPGQIALQKAQLQAAKDASDASRAATAEKTTSSGLNKLLLQHNQGYGADINGWNNNVKAIGREMNLPVNASTGMPDTSTLNAETLKAFKARIGAPPSSSERLAVFKQQMSDASVPLEQQVKAEALFDKSFGTGASISEVDKKNLDTKTKQLDERLAARKKSSMLYPGTEEEKQTEIQATQTFFDGQMKDSLWVGSHKKAIDTIMFDGLEVDGITYPIPPKLMKLALSTSMDKDSNLFNTTEGQVKAFLTDYVQQPSYEKELRTLAEIEADPTGAVAKKKLLGSYSRPTMGTGPVQYMNALTDAIDSANARAQAEAAKAQKKTQ